MILEPINLQPDAAFAETGQSNGQIHQFKEDYRPITRGQYKGQYSKITDWRARISAEDYAHLESREKRAESTKQQQAEFTGRGKTLSKEEADQLFEPFTAALMDFGGYGDDGLRLYAPVELPEDDAIWGDLTQDEAEALAKPLLHWGQKSPEVAFAVRAAVQWKDYAALIAVLVPRLKRTNEVVTHAHARYMAEVQSGKRPRHRFTFFRTIGRNTVEADDQRATERSPESV